MRNLLRKPWIYNLILAWLLTALGFLAAGGSDFMSKGFVQDINIILFAGIMIVLWVIIDLLPDTKFIRILMITTCMIYFSSVSSIRGDNLYTLALCALFGGILYFTDISDIRLKIDRRIAYVTVICLTLIFIGVIGGNCCLIILNHGTTCFDFGLFSQMFRYMKNTGLPYTTCERDVLMSHFAVHMSPAYYLIMPVYYLIPSPLTLDICQAVIVASGIIPLLKIMKHHSISNGAIIMFSLMYLLFPGFAGGCFFHLHENCFLALFVLWLVYAFEKESSILRIVFTILVLSVKEDAAIYAASIALYFLLVNKKRILNSVILICSVLYFMCVTHYLTNSGDGVMISRYNDLLLDGNGFMSMITTIAKDPAYLISQISITDKLTFLALSLLSLGGFPILTKDARRYILFIPYLLIHLMPNHHYQYEFNWQYCFGTCALLIYLAVINYKDIKRPKALLFGVCCSLMIMISVNSPRLTYLTTYTNKTEVRNKINAAMETIPQDASVAASTFLITDLSDHKELYELERTNQKTEYYALELDRKSDDYHIEDYLNNQYELIFYEPDVIAVFRDKDYGNSI